MPPISRTDMKEAELKT